MNYNFSFEIATIIFITFILIDFQTKKHYHTSTTTLFIIFAIFSLFDSVFNVLSCIMIYFTDYIPVEYNILVATIFFIIQSIDTYFFFAYTYRCCGADRGFPQWMFNVCTLPFIFSLLAAITTPVTHFFFYFNNEKQYVQGFGSAFGYTYIFFYVLISLLFALAFVHRLRRTHLLIILIYCAASMIAITIQFYDKSLLLTGIARAISVLVMYISLESPNDYIDKLTGLYNSFAFQTTIPAKVKRGSSFSVIYIDINKFRFINSVFGYENGDQLLMEIAKYLADNKPARTKCYRINKDTFTILMEGTDTALREYVSRLQQRFSDAWLLPGTEVNLHASFVVLSYPEHFDNISTLNYRMRYLMQYVKENEQQNVLFASKGLLQDSSRSEDVALALQNAISTGTLQVYYQPIHNERGVIAAEALVRIVDDRLGLIPPDEFIELAERNGLIIKLGDFVFEEVCRFISETLHNPSPIFPLDFNCIHVNLSIIQCMQPDLADRYLAIIDRYRIPPQMINLEITERMALSSPDMLLANMNKLIAGGVQFSLDDFGTGNSNLSYLIQFPFTTIKFDKFMVWTYFKNPSARIIMNNEFSSLHTLGKKIVVEGVETADQLALLKEKEIDLFQGYYFSKPVPKDNFILYLQSS